MASTEPRVHATAIETVAILLARGWTLDQLDAQAQLMLTGATTGRQRAEYEAYLDAIDTLQAT